MRFKSLNRVNWFPNCLLFYGFYSKTKLFMRYSFCFIWFLILIMFWIMFWIMFLIMFLNNYRKYCLINENAMQLSRSLSTPRKRRPIRRLDPKKSTDSSPSGKSLNEMSMNLTIILLLFKRWLIVWKSFLNFKHKLNTF